MKKRILSLLMAVAMLMTLLPIIATAAFSDTGDHWANAAIEKWRDLGIIHGDSGKFRPDDPITRGEMAVIMDRIMNYQTGADNTYTDLGQAFYTDAILKAIEADILQDYGSTVCPTEEIIREDAAVMMAKALGLDKSSVSAGFSDSDAFSSDAAGYINALAEENIVHGSSGNFNPKSSLTRAEAITLVNNAITTLYDTAGEYTGTVTGTAIVNTSGVVLKDMTISGDLIISEGVGTGDVTLQNVTVMGNTIIRGGGPDSIHITGTSHLTAVIIEKTDDGQIRVVTEDGAVVDAVYIDDGSDDIILTGVFKSVTIAAAVKVITVGAQIETLNITADDAVLEIDSASTIGSLFADALSTVNNNGTITLAEINVDNVTLSGKKPLKVVYGTGVQGASDTGRGAYIPPAINITEINVVNQTTISFTSNIAGASISWDGTILSDVTTVKGLNEVLVPPMVSGANNTLTITKTGYTAFTTSTIIWMTDIPAEYYTGTGFHRSTTPIIETIDDGDVTQSINNDGSISITVQNSKGYIDSGFVINAGTLSQLGSITVNGTGDFGLNLYFDLDGDGKFFTWNSDDTFNNVSPDAYALCNGGPFSGPIEITGATEFILVNSGGAVGDGGSYTLAQLMAKYPNARAGIWIGVTSSDGAERTATISSITTSQTQPTVENTSELLAAIDAVDPGSTIYLAEGVYALTQQLRITKPLTLLGIGQVKLTADPENTWPADNDTKHLLLVANASTPGSVVISNITLDSGSAAYGVQAYESANVQLTDVSITNSAGAGLTVNGSTIKANKLNTNSNAWGAVNVDPGSGVTTPSVFTLTGSGTLSENQQIWSDGKYVDSSANATIDIQVPGSYQHYHVVDVTNYPNYYVWNNKPIGASIEGSAGTIYFSIQAAINAADSNDTINAAAGEYRENVVVNKDDITIIGAGSDKSFIIATTANSTPLTFSANDTTVSDFTLTHEYTDEELSAWNFNNNGVTFNQSKTGNTLKNCTVTLNRNGIYLNNCQNNLIENNIITNNRTGINMCNNISGTKITGNTISSNWTLGLVFYDNNIAADLSSVTVNGNTFDQNWYSEILMKDATSTTPLVSTGVLDVSGNSFTDNPVTYTKSADASLNEPGFSAQKPAVPGIGGDAVKPAVDMPTLRNCSTGTAVLKYNGKTLKVGTTADAFGTIMSAIDAAASGDTISIAAGTYDEVVTVSEKSLTIIGAGKDETFVKAISAYPGTDNTLTIQNLAIYGNNASGQSYAGIFISNGIITIENCDITAGTGADKTKRGIETQYNNSANIVVRNCTFSGYEKSPYFNPSSGFLLLENNTFLDTGLSIDPPYDAVTISGNTGLSIGLFIGYDMLDDSYEEVLASLSDEVKTLAIATHQNNPDAVVKLSTNSGSTWGGFYTTVEDGELVITGQYISA